MNSKDILRMLVLKHVYQHWDDKDGSVDYEIIESSLSSIYSGAAVQRETEFLESWGLLKIGAPKLVQLDETTFTNGLPDIFFTNYGKAIACLPIEDALEVLSMRNS